MPKPKAIVLCSGGLNSAVCAAQANSEYQLALLHVRLASRAADKEAELVDALATHYKVHERIVVDMPHFAAMGCSARFGRKRIIEDALALADGPSNCHVPGLIGSLLCAAYTWAWTISASKVYLGVSENLGPPAPPTRHIYPDYSREYVDLCCQMLETASPNRTLDIETPLIDLHRGDIVRLGRRMGAPFAITWSCVAGGDVPCARCAGCATRQRGFLDAGVPDPLMLAQEGNGGRRHDPRDQAAFV